LKEKVKYKKVLLTKEESYTRQDTKTIEALKTVMDITQINYYGKNHNTSAYNFK